MQQGILRVLEGAGDSEYPQTTSQPGTVGNLEATRVAARHNPHNTAQHHSHSQKHGPAVSVSLVETQGGEPAAAT